MNLVLVGGTKGRARNKDADGAMDIRSWASLGVVASLALACSWHMHSTEHVQHRPYNFTICQFEDFKSHSSLCAGCVIQVRPGIIDRRSTRRALVTRGKEHQYSVTRHLSIHIHTLQCAKLVTGVGWCEFMPS
jgi:hypothetical protein